MQKEGRLYLSKDGIVVCKRREEDKVLYKYNAIVLPHLYQTELLFRSLDKMGHQGIDKYTRGEVVYHVLVMIDHFTKYAEAVPCITASAEETCDHLINTWIARQGCPMTFQVGMREVGNSMTVMPTGQGFKEIAISLAVDRVI